MIRLNFILKIVILVSLFSCTNDIENQKPKSLTFNQKIEKIDRIVDEVDRRKNEFKRIDLADGNNSDARWKSVAYKFGPELKLVEEVYVVNGIKYVNKYYFEIGYLHFIEINRKLNNEIETKQYYFWVDDILRTLKNGSQIEVLGEKRDDLIERFQEKEKEIKNMLKSTEYLPELRFRPQDFFYE